MITRRALGLGLAALPVVARAAERVRIGYQKNGSLVLLRQQKRLDGLIAVDWVEFPSGPPLLEALNAGAIDFGATGDTPPLFAQAAGADLLYVGAQPIAGRNQALLVPRDSPAQGVADLRGKRVAFTKGSSAHNMMLQVLRSAGMKPADLQHVNLQPPDAGAAFRTGALDAWCVWDPFYAVAELEPTTRVLVTGVPSNQFFLASRAFTERAPGTVQTLLGAINAAAAWAAAHPEELAETMAAVTGVPIAAQRVAAPRGVYAVEAMSPGIVAQQQATADAFAALRVLPTNIDVSKAVWTARA